MAEKVFCTALHGIYVTIVLDVTQVCALNNLGTFGRRTHADITFHVSKFICFIPWATEATSVCTTKRNYRSPSLLVVFKWATRKYTASSFAVVVLGRSASKSQDQGGASSSLRK